MTSAIWFFSSSLVLGGLVACASSTGSGEALRGDGDAGLPTDLDDCVPLASDVRVRLLERFDASASEHAEAVVVDARGRVFVSLHAAAALYVREPDGSSARVPLPDGPFDGATRANGLALLDETPYLAVRSDRASHAGVWRLRDGALQRVAALPTTARINGMAADPERGRLLVTDDSGRILAVDPIAGRHRVWSDAAILAPTAPEHAMSDASYGANGIAVDSGAVYVSVPATASLWRLPIRADGSMGEAEALLSELALGATDDFDLHPRTAQLVAAQLSEHEVVLIELTSARKLVLANAQDGLNQPTAAVFAPGENGVAYVTSGAFYAERDAPGSTLMKLSWTACSDRP
jgi:sugar lactone lactonase YvrE